jgi:mannose-6-phosphate isomerase-like protein (cupin superfamily)
MPDGSTYIVVRTAAETGGQWVEMEFVLSSGCVPPPPHVHPVQVEEYEVLEGSLEVVVDGAWRTLGPGQSVSVPVGALHTFRNRSGGVVHVRNWHRPAMRFEDFIETTCTTLRAAGIRRRRDPRALLYLSMVMLDFGDTLAPGRLRAAADAGARPHRSEAASSRILSRRSSSAPRVAPGTRRKRGSHSRLA